MIKHILATKLVKGDVLVLPFGKTATITDHPFTGRKYVTFHTEFGETRLYQGDEHAVIRPDEFQYAGTISHGTLRSEDLIVAFLPVLEDLDKSAYQQVISGDDPLDHQIVALLNIDGSANLPEELNEAASELVVWLIESLEACAPDGWHFSTVEGDGSDFGFWQSDDDDSDYPDDEAPGIDPISAWKKES